MQASHALLAMALLTTGALVAADLSIQILEPHPKHPNACYDADADKAYPVDSSWFVPDQCTKATCSKDANSNKFVIQYMGCGLMATPPAPCKLETNKKAQYPDCCPKVVCP
ncbi:Uncharacterized protein GBIM_18893 [Gryllus bimaculatus]|nr:Uncharacterized protein GBIM_18893 [Gryllus bimaculatus]